MDLGAYVQIDDIDEIAKKNNIEVPRLRGYRLMRDEKPIDIKKEIDTKRIAVDCVEDLCTAIPFWDPNSCMSELSDYTDYLKTLFLVKSKDKENSYSEFVDVRWDRIHGWKRKILKTYIHNEYKRQCKQWEVWNKYVGRDDILYIHARIGGGNWPYYYDKVVDQPWFIEKVDDSFDHTYCDIYAKIEV